MERVERIVQEGGAEEEVEVYPGGVGGSAGVVSVLYLHVKFVLLFGDLFSTLCTCYM